MPVTIYKHVRENGRKRMRRRGRENPCRFLLRLIHLHYSIERGRREKERERGRRRERTKGRNSESERGTQHTRTHIQAAKELSAILFYLSRLPLDRIHRFLTLVLSSLLRTARVSTYISTVKKGTGEKLCAKERKVA